MFKYHFLLAFYRKWKILELNLKTIRIVQRMVQKRKSLLTFLANILKNLKVGWISYRNYLLGFINILFGRYYNIPFYVFILFSLLSSYNMCKFSVRNARLCGGYWPPWRYYTLWRSNWNNWNTEVYVPLYMYTKLEPATVASSVWSGKCVTMSSSNQFDFFC